MKKIIFIMMILISSVTNSYSQENNDNQLITHLKNYDENTTGKVIRDEAGRRWWQAVLNFCAVAGADILGAYGGVQASSGVLGALGLSTGGLGAALVGGGVAIVSGAGASHATYQSLRMTAPNSVSFGGLLINVPSQFEYLSNAGKSHNTVLNDYFFNQGDITNFYRTILTEDQIQIIQSDLMQQKIAAIKTCGTNYANANYSIEVMSDELFNKGLMTKTGKTILEEFYRKYKNCNSPESMQGLINYYISEISESSVSQLEKQSLIAALMVASESPFYMATR